MEYINRKTHPNRIERQKMKIIVTGTRGIPGIQGGVETHCEELFPRIADEKHEVIVIRRPEYKSIEYGVSKYKGVTIKDIKTLPGKHFEAITHTFIAVLYARKIHADIVHIHAIGPSLMIPIVRILGMKAVMTHHGPDYDRQKWGKLSKSVLKIGEKLGVKYANHVIVISQHIRNIVQRKCPTQKKISLIYNGVNLTCSQTDNNYLKELGVEKYSYILAVGRFVKEKGFDLLLEAYKNLYNTNIKLIIAGDADHEDQYSSTLKNIAQKQGVILTGFIQKDKLSQLYSFARLFVLPSYHEGLPISLLEAMNCCCDVLVSDIPANKEVGLNDSCYFKCGDIQDLKNCLDIKLQSPLTPHKYNMTSYNWDHIAQQTKDIYDSLSQKTI